MVSKPTLKHNQPFFLAKCLKSINANKYPLKSKTGFSIVNSRQAS